MEKKFLIDYAGKVAQLERVLKKLKIKKIFYKTILSKGLDFDSYVPFESMDDSNLIDWKASLRANQLIKRKYIEEREFNVYFAVDVSNNMLFGSGDKLKAEYLVEIVATLSYLIMNSGDNIGVLLFNNKDVKFINPGRGKNHFYLILKYLSDPNLYGDKLETKEMVDSLLLKIRSPFSIVFLISDFVNLKEDSRKRLNLLSTKFETIAIMIRDPLDNSLDNLPYQIIIEDPSSNEQMVVDPGFAKQLYTKNAMKQKRYVSDILRECNIDLLDISTEENFVIPLLLFLKNRIKKPAEEVL